MNFYLRVIVGVSVMMLLLVTPFLGQSKSPVFSDPKSSGFFKPKLTIEGDATHDFGDIYKGQKVTHLFTILNAGTDTLLIKYVSASCGCTAAMVSSSVVPPRGKTQLQASFDSRGFGGNVAKYVTIASNDPDSPTTQVTIEANVVSVFELSSPYILVQRAKPDSVSTATIELKNATGKIVKIVSVEPKLDGLRIEVPKKSVKPGESTTLKASFKPTKEGMATGDVTVKTDFTPQPDVSIRFTANVRK